MAKMGRPRKEIDQKQFEALCGIWCTLEEICSFFHVTDKTLNSWCRRTYGETFSEVFKQKRNIGNISLRRYQFQAAKKGNVTMLIWLGKQRLGQTDKVQMDTSAVMNKLDAVLDGIKEDADSQGDNE